MTVDDPLLLSRFSEFLARQIGLHFPEERWPDLLRGMNGAAREFRFGDSAACMQWLLSAPLSRPQIEVLSSHLTVGETYFFRDPAVFDALQTHILPELIQSRRPAERRLRLWSAGCSTGEEAYSLAILLQRWIPDYKQWNLTILGTDINPHALRKAMTGAYGEWSFRNAPAWLRQQYFHPATAERHQVTQAVRDMVLFSYLNLAEDAYPSLPSNTNAMDIIFCRNVLMYFTPEQAKQVVEKLHRSLVDGGWLIVSPAEASSALLSSFSAVPLPGAVLFRKSPDARLRPASFQPPPPLAALPEIVLPTRRSVPSRPKPATPASLPGAASAIRHQDPDVHCHKARDCADQGRLGEAAGWCEKAIAADKLNPAHYYLLATIRQEQGLPDAAAQALKQALYVDPEFVLAHFTLGNLRLAAGHPREAERHFSNALELLRKLAPDAMLAESGGLSAGRLAEIITFVMSSLPQRGYATAA